MRIGEYVIRTNVYEGEDYQIYLASKNLSNEIVSLFVFAQKINPESPGLKILGTFEF